MNSRLPSHTCTSCNRETKTIYCTNCISSVKRWTIPSYILAMLLGFITLMFTLPVSGYDPFYIAGGLLGVATILSIPTVRYSLATRTRLRLVRSKYFATVVVLVILSFLAIPT